MESMALVKDSEGRYYLHTDGYTRGKNLVEDLSLDTLSDSNKTETSSISLLGDIGASSIFIIASASVGSPVGLKGYWYLKDSLGVQRSVKRPMYVDNRATSDDVAAWVNINTIDTNGWGPLADTGYEILLFDPSDGADVLPVTPDGWTLELEFSYNEGGSDQIDLTCSFSYKRA